MERKEYRLNSCANSINIKTYTYDINVYTDNVSSPIILVKGDITLERSGFSFHNDVYVGISEKLSETHHEVIQGTLADTHYVRFNSDEMIIFLKDGRFNRNDFTIYKNEMGSIDLVLPNKGYINKISATSDIGDINVKGINSNTLTLSKLIASTRSSAGTHFGNITIEDFLADLVELQTGSGNISAELLESKANYNIYNHSMCGKVEIAGEEIDNTQSTVEHKYILNTFSETGDIKVLFKGKN